jgi:hypothetical protein
VGEPPREHVVDGLVTERAMKTKPDLKFGDRVVFIGDGQKRGVVSRVFRSGGLWWLALEGDSDWRYAPRYFMRVE